MDVLLHPSISGKSALHWAAAVNNVEATLVLLKNGANRDMQDNKVCACVFTCAVLNHCSLLCLYEYAVHCGVVTLQKVTQVKMKVTHNKMT